MSAFKSEVQGKINIIHCPKTIEESACKYFELVSHSQWSNETVLAHLFDFKETESILPPFYKVMSVFKKNLEKRGVKLFSLHLSKALQTQLKTAGVDSAFGISDSLQSVVQSLSAKK